MNNLINVRPAELQDLPLLANIEAKIWRNQGAKILSLEDLVAWFEENTPLFLVAENNGEVCGYYFARFIEFSFGNTDDFISSERIQNESWHVHYRHNPSTKTIYGVSVVSAVKGAGAAMNTMARKIWKGFNVELCIGFTRLSGLNEYLSMIEREYGKLPYAQDDIALWYAHENAEQLSLRKWKDCTPKPLFELPKLLSIDPVFGFHSQDKSVGLLRVIPDYMPDNASRNYGAFIAQDLLSSG